MIEIENKYIKSRGAEIRSLVNFLNKNYDIPHLVHLHILQFPCVYDEERNPAFGLFYVEADDSVRIEIANELEWYEKALKKKLGKKFCTAIVLETLAHETYHYFQYRDNKKIIENWVDHQSEKILIKYLNSKTCKSVLNHTSSFDDDDDTFICAIDPFIFLRKKANLK